MQVEDKETKEYDQIRLTTQRTQILFYLLAAFGFVCIVLCSLSIGFTKNDTDTIAKKFSIFHSEIDGILFASEKLPSGNVSVLQNSITKNENQLNPIVDSARSLANSLNLKLSEAVTQVSNLTTILEDMIIQLDVLNATLRNQLLTPKFYMLNCNNDIFTVTGQMTNTIFIVNSTDCIINVPMLVGLKLRFVALPMHNFANTITLLDGGAYVGYIHRIVSDLFQLPNSLTENSIAIPCGIETTSLGDYVELEVISSSLVNVNAETQHLGIDWSSDC